MKGIRRIKVDLQRADFDFLELLAALDRLWERAAFHVRVLLDFSEGAVRHIPAVADYMTSQMPRAVCPVVSCALPYEHLEAYRVHAESMNPLLVFADLGFASGGREPEATPPLALPFVYRVELRSRLWPGRLAVAERILTRGGGTVFLTMSRASFHGCSRADWDRLLALRRRDPERLWLFDDFLYTVFDGVRAGTPRDGGLRKLFGGRGKILLTCGRRVGRQEDAEARQFAEHVAGCPRCRRKLEQVEV